MRRDRGFTLIEVMITVAIVAILAAIAIPSYSEYMRRSHITEAVSVLSNMRVRMEQLYQDERSYGAACSAAANAAPAPAATAHFTFTCTVSTTTPNLYTVTATGIAGSTMAGAVYTINQNNVRTTTTPPAGWAGAGAACWVLKKDGSC